VLAVAAAVRGDPDFSVRVLFKKVTGFSMQPAFADMLRDEPVIFSERGGHELSAAIEWADIVHLQNASPDVVALAKLKRKRLVLTIHNYMRHEWSLHRLLWRAGARFADARWYNSQFVWDTWEPRRKRRGSRKIPTTSKLPEGWTAPNERQGFVFIGRWIANKGIDTLVDAYALAELDRQSWPLVLMGDGPLRESIESRILATSVAGIHITGFVDEATKTRIVQNARWAVVPPNTKEDFGLTAIEARHLGVPCIITRDGGLPEAGGRQALVCEPGDVRSLARSLERAAKMPDSEYALRAERTRSELDDELVPITFYADAYRRIVRGEAARDQR
jgi:glycosyltransferase involved in cell wall biosynthesis